MSQVAAEPTASQVTANALTARAVVSHHAELSEGLTKRVEALVREVDSQYLLKAEAARQDLLSYLRREILPHAQAEEAALYPPAAALPDGRLLVEGMVNEHRSLSDLVAELANAGSLIRAAATARALAALFAVHLAKENDLVLPLLVATPEVSLTQILSGMHEVLGKAGGGEAHGDEAGEVTGAATDAAGAGGGCGCGGCGCGGDQPAGAAPAPVLSVDKRRDVRAGPPPPRPPQGG
ncbi:MAG: hemerythrin domain-containing protein, partial [Micromonosporaceae bacterium]|nr:hemerythrin domain-containing protein [Micromonosporaceae bacterium]